MTRRVDDETKRARGTWRADRAKPARPIAAAKSPKPPPGADPDVRRFYREHAARLASDGRLTPADWPAFALMAEAWADARAARRKLATDGRFRFDENHVERKSPALMVWREAAAAYGRLAREFGMTPAARERIGAPAPDDGSALTRELREILADPLPGDDE